MSSESGSGDEREEVNLLDDQAEMVDFFEEDADVAAASNSNRPPEETNALEEGMECSRKEDESEDVEEGMSTSNDGDMSLPQHSQEVEVDNMAESGSVVAADQNLPMQAQVTGREREEVSNANVVQVASVYPMSVFQANIDRVCAASDKVEDNQDLMESANGRPPQDQVGSDGMSAAKSTQEKEGNLISSLPTTRENFDEKSGTKSKKRAVGPARKRPRKDPPKRVGWYGEDVYTVEEVIDSRIQYDKDGNSYNEYCVRWLGYGKDHNTWARESETFEEKIKEYWLKILKKINQLNKPMLNVPVAQEPTSLCYFDVAQMKCNL